MSRFHRLTKCELNSACTKKVSTCYGNLRRASYGVVSSVFCCTLIESSVELYLKSSRRSCNCICNHCFSACTVCSTVNSVRETLVNTVKHHNHLSTVHVVTRTNTAGRVVTLKYTVVSRSLNDVGVPLSAWVIDELRSVTCRSKSEGACNEGSSFSAVNVCARTTVARLAAVAVTVTTYPSFFTCFLEIPVIPSSCRNVREACNSWRSGKNSTVQLYNQLNEFSTVGRIATAEPSLCSIEVTCVNESVN